MELHFKLLNTDAKLPTYGSEFAAGFDLSACEESVIPAHISILIKTGRSVQ